MIEPENKATIQETVALTWALGRVIAIEPLYNRI